jgi:carbon-monoxide dehydrogenase medium subunit
VAAAVVDGATRVAFASMAPTPIRARAVEEALASGAGAAEAAGHSSEGADPPSDVTGSAQYRAHLAEVYVRRALEQL